MSDVQYEYLQMKQLGASQNPSRAVRIYSVGDWSAVNDLNTLRPRQNGRHFADYIFKHIIMNENVWIAIKISLKFVPKGPINNIPSLVQIMAWRRPSDKPLSEPMTARLPTHICVTQPQWVTSTGIDAGASKVKSWPGYSWQQSGFMLKIRGYWFYQYPLSLSFVND